jgi:hypothetical protein
MKEYQSRALNEQDEVHTRLEHLKLFIEGNFFRSLDISEQRRLNRQVLIMKLYDDVLIERMLNFK